MLLWTISVQGLESITEKNNKNKIKRIAGLKKKKKTQSHLLFFW